MHLTPRDQVTDSLFMEGAENARQLTFVKKGYKLFL